MNTLHRPILPPPRWAWVPHAATAFLLAAVAVALLLLRGRFLSVAGRLGIDPTRQRIFSLGALLLAGVGLWRCWREARRAVRLFHGREP